MKAIITVIGHDRIGIIAGVSNILAQYNVNILDINQTIMQDYFTMIMLVDMSSMNLPMNEIKEKLDEQSKLLKVSIKLQHEDIFRSMHRI